MRLRCSQIVTRRPGTADCLGLAVHVRWRWFLSNYERNRMADGWAATREKEAGVQRGVRPLPDNTIDKSA